ncbi:MAG TPA: GNAT family N-acetyltransferase [Pyrinomonadaceae bacterium]|jgi:ribosomal-protein-alanine N-acetyltransferase|nr:GNAT family N-acetyltransferase [Pyrinomonadaceae bacterium]
MFPQIETERLLLRTYKPDEMEKVFELSSDKDVTKHFPPYFRIEKKEVLASLPARLERWRTQGFGQFGVFDKADGNLIGYCGFQYLDQTQAVEIYYGFFKKHWGKGFATEAARAALRFGFEQAKLPKITAVTHPENIESQKVLRKIGFNGGELTEFYKMPVVYFEITVEQYEPDDSFYNLSFTEG